MSKAEELFGCKSESKNLHAFQQNLWIAFIFDENVPTTMAKSQYMFCVRTTNTMYGKCGLHLISYFFL